MDNFNLKKYLAENKLYENNMDTVEKGDEKDMVRMEHGGKISAKEFGDIKQHAEDYPLDDGSRLYVWQETINGFGGVGETMVKMALDNGTLVDFKKVENRLELRHRLDIESWMDDAEDGNKAAIGGLR